MTKAVSGAARSFYDAFNREGDKVLAEYETCGCQVDLVIKRYRMAIECDGEAFHSLPTNRSGIARKRQFWRNTVGPFCISMRRRSTETFRHAYKVNAAVQGQAQKRMDISNRFASQTKNCSNEGSYH
jgi:hypothetical protein